MSNVTNQDPAKIDAELAAQKEELKTILKRMQGDLFLITFAAAVMGSKKQDPKVGADRMKATMGKFRDAFKDLEETLAA